MRYQKPELIVLGSAAEVIENMHPHKPALNNDGTQGTDPSYELDE